MLDDTIPTELDSSKYCRHCGWPVDLHKEERGSDVAMKVKGHFDCSFNDCPGFEPSED